MHISTGLFYSPHTITVSAYILSPWPVLHLDLRDLKFTAWNHNYMQYARCLLFFGNGQDCLLQPFFHHITIR